MEVAIIKYNAGNVESVQHALRRLGVEPLWTDDPERLQRADRVIFPGVGEASSAMAYLRNKQLDRLIPTLRQPTLGICLGLQLFCAHSDENDTPCLGIFPEVRVRKFSGANGSLKVPHMGWNNFTTTQGPLFEGINSDDYVYFVHSYYAESSSAAIATAEYGEPFSAALHRDNFYAVQFHPERSGAVGQRVLEGFLRG
jgi:imidazole glycerol-phosphate synthase subunit HisH